MSARDPVSSDVDIAIGSACRMFARFGAPAFVMPRKERGPGMDPVLFPRRLAAPDPADCSRVRGYARA